MGKGSKKNSTTFAEAATNESIRAREESLLQWERRLLEREKTLNDRINESHCCSRSDNFSFADISSALTEFTGQDHYDIRAWIEEVENVAKLMKWSELEIFIYARRLLKGSAKIAARSKPTICNWVELKTFLIDEFAQSVPSVDIHRQLSRQRQGKDDSVFDYFLKMREIASTSRGKIEDEAIIQYVIDGINDSDHNKIILYGARDMKDFKEKLRAYNQFKEAKGAQRRSEEHPSIKIRCYNCGGKGHKSTACMSKSKGTKCFHCNNFGHKANECPKKGKEEKQVKCLDSGKHNEAFKLIRINNYECKSLIDTGSDITIMSSNAYSKIGSPVLKGPTVKVQGLSKDTVETMGCLKVDLVIDDDIYSTTAHVIGDLQMQPEVIIGRDVLNKTQITVSDEGIKVRKLEEILSTCYQVCESETPEVMVGNDQYKQTILSIINEYKPVQKKQSNVEMKIVLKTEEPIAQHARRLSPLEKSIVDNQIKDWLQEGVVRESSSEFASPIVLANKKNGDKRLCIDYRRLNKMVVRDRYPLPLIEDQIDRLHGARIFSTLDLENGFFHVRVAEDSVKYTSFVTPSGQYEFLRMPFGLCTSPTVFQKFINNIFKPLMQKGSILIYMDDIVALAKDEEENLKVIAEVLSIAQDYGLKFRWGKCQFLCSSIEYLGYRIEAGHIRPSDLKTKAVARFPEPKSLKNIQGFLGLTGYFRKFIPSYAQIARPLSDILRKASQFEFGPKQRFAFQELKRLLTIEPVLKIYNPEAETELHTDASKHGYGAVLLQRDSQDNNFHPTYFYSRKTSDVEQRYSSYELEVLAIVSALKKLRVYLLGLRFKIVTDCAAFKMTMLKKDIAPRIAGWALLLQDYNYELEHRPNSKMVHVDALSRNPIVMAIQSDLLLRIRQAQINDERIKLIRTILEKEGKYKSFFMEREILYENDDQGNKLLCIPKAMQMEIVKSAHDEGHFGIKKTEEILKREFSIPKLRKVIDKCRRNCIACILTDRKSGKQEGLLNPIVKDNYPLGTYHIDHLGPLSNTAKKYKYIFTVIDAFTKFVWLYPTKTTNAVEVVTKLELQKSVFGNPERIISDRGAAFTSNVFKEYCEKENIQHLLITTGVPRGNGQVERMHRTIISTLAKLTIDDPSKWYKYTNDLQRFLNSTYQRSTRKSPFELLIGVKMRSAKSRIISEAIDEAILDEFNDDREFERAKAKENILKMQDENIKSYNKKRCNAFKYKIGDLVAIKRTQFGPTLKLHSKFLGPYKVKTVSAHDRYEVEKVGEHEGPKTTTTSADYMKPWVSPNDEYDTETTDDEASATIPDDPLDASTKMTTHS